jgi:hypothetical protein
MSCPTARNSSTDTRKAPTRRMTRTKSFVAGLTLGRSIEVVGGGIKEGWRDEKVEREKRVY